MIEKELGTCILHRNCRGTDSRVVGNCRRCRREVVVHHGHLATPVTKETLLCGRCQGR